MLTAEKSFLNYILSVWIYVFYGKICYTRSYYMYMYNGRSYYFLIIYQVKITLELHHTVEKYLDGNKLM